VRQLVVFQSRPVRRLRFTQLGVLARPLTRTSPRGGSRVGKVGGVGTGCKVVARINIEKWSGAAVEARHIALLAPPKMIDEVF
jgi:hypothetical protein